MAGTTAAAANNVPSMCSARALLEFVGWFVVFYQLTSGFVNVLAEFLGKIPAELDEFWTIYIPIASMPVWVKCFMKGISKVILGIFTIYFRKDAYKKFIFLSMSCIYFTYSYYCHLKAETSVIRVPQIMMNVSFIAAIGSYYRIPTSQEAAVAVSKKGDNDTTGPSKQKEKSQSMISTTTAASV